MSAQSFTRFIYSSREIRGDASNPYVHWSAFKLPSTGRSEVSVMRVDGLDERQVWKSHPRKDRNVHGRADFGPPDVAAVGLRLVEDEPPPRHHVIVGWPEEKEDRVERAQTLASRCVARRYRAE